MTRVTSLVLLATACGASPPATTAPPPAPIIDAAIDAPVPLDQDLPRLATEATALYREVAQAFAAAGQDCAAATTKLLALQAAHADVIAANAMILRDGRARELRAALEPHAEALEASAKAIVESSTMASCTADRAFTDAFDNLVGAPP